MARVQAQAGGQRDVAELLDYARVVPSGQTFTMELALPQAFLERYLAQCGRRAPGPPPASGPAAPASGPASAPSAPGFDDPSVTEPNGIE